MSTETLLDKFSLAQPDTLCYSQPALPHNEETQEYLIFFMPGNPGVVSYYEPFLSRLHSLLVASNSDNARYHICAHSYRGFELSPYAEPPDCPFGLEQQIKYQEKLLLHHVKEHKATTGKIPKVILMGHSVGAYVLLELIRGHVEAVSENDVDDFDLIGGILLFPTIADIAQSPLGRVARIVLPLPGFARVIGALARSLTQLLPESALYSLVRLVTKFPEHAINATTAFIKSSMGVRQALHLARDEMEIITKADWSSEVWGAATSPGTNKRDTINWNLMVYWGKGDKWVADHTRDQFIEARGLRHDGGCGIKEGKSRMEIDEEGIPHDFCTTIRNSYLIGGKVKTWIEDIIEAHSKAL